MARGAKAKSISELASPLKPSTDRPSQSPIEQDLGFDTEDIDPAHRVEAYRSLYDAGGDVEILGPRFRAAMRLRRCGGLMLYHRVLSDVAHRRDAERVRRDGFDH